MHGVPSAFDEFTHIPVTGSHAPPLLHWSAGAQMACEVPLQTPVWHTSFLVQMLPSSHGVPLVFAGFEHIPVAGLQTPALWHESCGAQVTGLAPAHVPAWQVSVWVQPLPSSHAAPLGFAGFEHTPVAGLQTPALWH